LLADTTFLIDVMKNDESAIRKAKQLSDSSIPVLIGTPTVFELYVGVGLSVRSNEERQKVLRILTSLPQMPLDGPSASKAGMIYAQRVKDKMRIDAEDAMLAGIAVQNNEPLLTRNKKDFSGILDLKIETY
jgi:tRNA(fMet)-specific endonuclease VapC